MLFTKTFSPELLSTAVHKAIRNHVADRTQFILMACYSTIIMFVLQREVCNTYVHEKELISEYVQRSVFVQRQDGSVTLCSSILLACERMMRLKKSSSGTVGPREEGGGGAHL